METISVRDKQFTLAISQEEIAERVAAVAREIETDLAGETPLFLVVLNGAFVFAADLLRQIQLPCEVAFIKLSSYDGMETTGKVKEIVGLTQEVKGRTLVVVEDIIDTGRTMQHLLSQLATRQPKQVRVATLFLKPGKVEVPVQVDYAAMRIADDFIVGYGLDYNGQGRNLTNIYKVLV